MNKHLKIIQYSYDVVNDIRGIETFVFENPNVYLSSNPMMPCIVIENPGMRFEIVLDNRVCGVNKLYLVLHTLFNRCSSEEDLKLYGMQHVDYFVKDGELRLEIDISACIDEDGSCKSITRSLIIVNNFDTPRKQLSNRIDIVHDILHEPFYPEIPLSLFEKYNAGLERNSNHIDKSLEEKIQKITPENKHEEQFTDSVGKENDFIDEIKENTDFTSPHEMLNLIPTLVKHIKKQDETQIKLINAIQKTLNNVVTFTNQKESDSINVLFEVAYDEDGERKTHSEQIGILPLINVNKLLRNPSNKEEIPTVGILNFLFPGHATQPGKLVKLLFRPDVKHRIYKNRTKSDFVAISKDFADFLTWYFKELTRYEFRTRITKIRLELNNNDAMVYAKASDINDQCIYSASTSGAIEFVNTVIDEDTPAAQYAPIRPSVDNIEESSKELTEDYQESLTSIQVIGQSHDNGHIEFTVDSLSDLEISDTEKGVWLKKRNVGKENAWQYVIPVTPNESKTIVLGDRVAALAALRDRASFHLEVFLEDIKDKDIVVIEIFIDESSINLDAKSRDGTLTTVQFLVHSPMTIAEGLEKYKSSFC